MCKKKLSTTCKQNDYKKSSICTQNELFLSAYCEQIEPQLSKGKIRIVKESKSKLAKTNHTIRSFLNSHNLNSIDERYEKSLSNFLTDNKKNETDCIGYCEYVYEYLNHKYKKVDAKLFFTVSLKKDVLFRFSRNKTENVSIYGNIKCPVCEKVHLLNGKAEDCTLDLSLPYSEEMINQARTAYANYCKSNANLFSGIKLSLLKNLKEKN